MPRKKLTPAEIEAAESWFNAGEEIHRIAKKLDSTDLVVLSHIKGHCTCYAYLGLYEDVRFLQKRVDALLALVPTGRLSRFFQRVGL